MQLSESITIGQYLPGTSFLYGLDPRTKLLQFILLLFGASFCTTYTGNLLFLLLFSLLFVIARVPLSYGWSGIKPALPFIIILALLQLLFNGALASQGTIYFHKYFITVSSANIRMIIVSTLRFIEIILLVSLLTLTTTLSDLSRAIEQLLKPLAFLKLPVYELSLVVMIALQFVPKFALEMEKIMKAQASRGASYGTARWWEIIKRTKETLPLFIPLFKIALSRAEDLVFAMEARAFVPGAPRSSYHNNRFSYIDGIVTAGVLATVLGILWV